MLNTTTYPCFVLKLLAVPKFLLRFSLRETNSCATSAIETLSVICLWPFNTARLLNLSPPILDRSHVFRRRADENERSPAALVAGFTACSLQIFWTTWISLFSGSGDFDTANRISLKHDTFSFNITSKKLSCPGGASVSPSSLYDASRNLNSAS